MIHLQPGGSRDPTQHLDRLAESWVERARDMLLASDCPVLFFLHLFFWFMIIWLLLWPGGGTPKRAGPLSGFIHWEGMLISMWRILNSHIQTRVQENDRRTNPRKIDRVSGATKEEKDGEARDGQREDLK